MRYLAPALIAEGPSDDQFLPALLTRTLEDICAVDVDEVVEVADVAVLRANSRPQTIPETLKLVQAHAMDFTLIFFHRDQGVRADRVKREWLDPLDREWNSDLPRLVRVVPVRETEAWMLADRAALCKVFGVRLPDQGLARPARVEKIVDPKAVLAGLGDRVHRPVGHYFQRLGEFVSLDQLKQVPAYQRCRDGIVDALVADGYRRR